jgi:hypothetical protein
MNSGTPNQSQNIQATLSTAAYYSEYHGHQVSHLERVHAQLHSAGCDEFVYLAGDSSLDNKHWFFEPYRTKEEQLSKRNIGKLSFVADASNGYETVLHPPKMVKDVSYWLNYEAAKQYGERKLCTIMTSVEESTVSDREDGLLAQDTFIRDHITDNDHLIVSVGGNDVALKPTIMTLINMKMLVSSPHWMIRCGAAPGFGYFMDLFHKRIEKYVRKLCAKNKPKSVLVCMIYYLDQVAGGSWADTTLAALGYDKCPETLQLVIKTLYEKISEKCFHVDGVDVRPFALFDVLDGKDSSDYEQRVEPSVTGGHKMATALLDALPSNARAAAFEEKNGGAQFVYAGAKFGGVEVEAAPIDGRGWHANGTQLCSTAADGAEWAEAAGGKYTAKTAAVEGADIDPEFVGMNAKQRR